MGKFTATFDGGIVAEPEAFQTANAHGIKFPVYVNERRKNRDTDTYEDTGNVSKIQVSLWNDAADDADFHKGDIVEVEAELRERAYEGKNGPGRQLETTFVNGITLRYRKDDGGQAPATQDPYGSELPW